MAKVDTGVLQNEATDFGPGPAARILYSGGSLVAFAIVMATERVGPPPFDLPLPPVVLVGVIAVIIMTVSGLAGGALSRHHK